MAIKIPNCHEIDQMAIKILQHLPSPDLPKFTQIGIFGLKIYVPSGNPIPSYRRYAD
jgi:hypothetical protein